MLYIYIYICIYIYIFSTYLIISCSLHVQVDGLYETQFCRPVVRIFNLTYERLISYLPVMLCKFHSNEYSHFICNSCLELRHLARVSLYGPCWRGPRRLAHLQVKYCTRVRLFYFAFTHVYLNLFMHVHKRLLFLYTIFYCHLQFSLLQRENTAFADLFMSDSFFVPFWLRTILFSPVFLRLSTATSYHSSFICRHSFVSFLLTRVLRKVNRDALLVHCWPLRHYTCERVCYCTYVPIDL